MRQTQTAIKLGLTPSTSKTWVMKIHSKTSSPILMNTAALKEMEAFMYRGGFADTTGGTDADTRSRINKARMVFNIVRKIRSSKKILSQHSKYASSTLQHEAGVVRETRKTGKRTMNRLQTFFNTCPRRILNIWWRDEVCSADLWERTSQDPIDLHIGKRKWRRVNLPRMHFRGIPQGNRRQGRPGNSWRRRVEAEMDETGLN